MAPTLPTRMGRLPVFVGWTRRVTVARSGYPFRASVTPFGGAPMAPCSKAGLKPGGTLPLTVDMPRIRTQMLILWAHPFRLRRRRRGPGLVPCAAGSQPSARAALGRWRASLSSIRRPPRPRPVLLPTLPRSVSRPFSAGSTLSTWTRRSAATRLAGCLL